MKALQETQGKNLKILGVVFAVIVVGLIILAAVVLLVPLGAIVIRVSGRATFDDGTPVIGAQVLGSVGGDASTAIRAVTDSNGNFTMELVSGALPVRVLVEVSSESALIPILQTARWDDAESSVLDVGTIILPNPEGAELTLDNGAGQSADNSIQVEGLTAEVNRLFARSYDPDNTPDAFPGEFAENGTIPLDSSVFLWMVGLDANGNPVEDLSQAATIRSLVPRSQWSDLVDINSGTGRIEVPIYTYNENTDVWEQEAELGWLEDSAGTVLPEDAQSVILDGTFSDNVFAVFSVNHLSWMNVDYPYIGP